MTRRRARLMAMRSLRTAAWVVAAWLLGSGCGTRTRPRPAELALARVSESFGFAAPVLLQGLSFTHGWVAACFAIKDTDRDGKLEVMVGRHGETFGDTAEPYLLLDGVFPEAIDEYVGSSPEGRFVAFMEQSRLWVVDAQSKQRRDLSALNPDLTERVHAALPHPTMAFLADQRAVVVRRSAEQSQLLLLDLTSGATGIIYTTTSDVARLEVVGDKLSVWTLPRGSVDHSFQTTLAPRHCRGPVSSYSSFRSAKDPAVSVDVAVPAVARPKAQKESIHGGLGCTEDGRKVLASSVDGQQHLVATFVRHMTAERGPLGWVVGTTPQACPRRD